MDYERMSREQLIGALREKDRAIERLEKKVERLELIFNYTGMGIVIGLRY